MAIKIDNDLLQELGLAALPEAEKNGLLKHIYETLEMRVGMRLADQMSNEQLDEFERYFDAKDDAGAFKWLEVNFPNYKDIVQEEFDKLKVEVGQSAPQILSASQQQMATAPGSVPQQQPQTMQNFGQPQSPQYQPQPQAPPAMPAQYQQPYQPPVQSQMAPYQPLDAPQAQPPAPQPPFEPQQPFYDQPAAPAVQPQPQPQPQPYQQPQAPQPQPQQPWQPPQQQ